MTTQDTFPLPDGWTIPERVEDEIVVGSLTIHRVGIAAVRDDEEASGSAAETTGSPRDRAFYELLERIAVADARRGGAPSFSAFDTQRSEVATLSRAEVFPVSDAPARWRYANTNGVAIHRTWEEACRRARLELIERDRVLRAWYGELTPLRIDAALEGSPLLSLDAFSWQAHSIPVEGDRINVVAVFGFPLTFDAPFVMGMAAREDVVAASEAAQAEALQQVAFLWGEPIPTETPPLGPTAMHHLELYQARPQHDLVHTFLAGGHRAFAPTSSSGFREPLAPVYVDLTPDALRGVAHVVKAISTEAVPLIFGESPFALHLPAERRPHPIA